MNENGQVAEQLTAERIVGDLALLIGKRCKLAMDKEKQNPERAALYGVLQTSAHDGAAWLLEVRDVLPRDVASQISWKTMKALAEANAGES